MFNDRRDAGEQLASMLEKYRNTDALVLAVPGGGIEVGCVVAKNLNLGFTPLVIRRLPCPHDPSRDFGTLAEDGCMNLSEDSSHLVPLHLLEWLIEENKRALEHDIETFRKDRETPDFTGKTVILTSEGCITASVMRAAVELCRRRGAGRVVLAAPVANNEVVKSMHKRVDEMVVVEKEYHIRCVSDAYRSWCEISTGDMVEKINHYRKELIAQ